jgi:hypothetical protein
MSERLGLRSAIWVLPAIALFACSSGEIPLGGAGGSAGSTSTGGGASGNGGAATSSGAGGHGAAPIEDAGSGGSAGAASDATSSMDAADAGLGAGDVSSVPSDARTEDGDAAKTPDGDAASLPARVLLYHFSTLTIDTVPAQLTFLKSKLAEWHFETDDSVDPSVFTDANLMRYGAVAMINTCFEPFGAGKPDRPQSEVLQRFVRRGGGLFGTHCAAVTFASANPPALYNQVFGGRCGGEFFDGRSDCRKTADHVATTALPATFVFNGNLDTDTFIAPDSTVLVRCKWSSGKEVAVSWYRTDGQGRVFYTNFAKIDADLKDATLGAGHIIPALQWVLGR